MSRRPIAEYIPAVEPTAWHSARGPIHGVMITIPANGAGLFISADNLRALADQLHDAADEIEGSTR